VTDIGQCVETPVNQTPEPARKATQCERGPRLLHKRLTVREDGRYVIYYEFGDVRACAADGQREELQ
jgi:hypothetical protein